MPSKVVYTDFRGGMIDERLRRRSDLSGYYNSASKLVNAVPTSAGGIRLRPGLKGLSTALAGAVRVISFTLSVDRSYAVVLWEGKLQLFSQGTIGYVGASEPFNTDYLAYEISEIQYGQDSERLILVHRNHQPFVIEADRINGGFIAGYMVLDVVRKEHRIDGSLDNSGELYDYKGLFASAGNYPSCVAFMANRLWFMSSINHPYRLWASRPFEYNNFQTVDYVQKVDESITTEQYLEAIEGSKFFREDLEGGGYRETSRVVDMNTGSVIETISTYDSEGNLIGSEDRTYKYTEPEYYWVEMQRADCAIMLDVASDRDERISWMGFMGSYISVGTASSEWLIPAAISAVDCSISKISSYGSAEGIQCVYGADSLFYAQAGARKIRAISMASGGLSNAEASYQCQSILSSGIKELVYQRVPESRLYVLLKDGRLAVYTYEPGYGIAAWSLWESEYKIESICMLDSPNGQMPIALGTKDGTTMLMEFRDEELSDNGWGFNATITTNNIEGDGTIPYVKKVFNIYVDSMGTEFTAMQDGLRPITPRNFDTKLVKLDIYSKSTLEGTRITLNSVAGKRFEVLALAVEVEVS